MDHSHFPPIMAQKTARCASSPRKELSALERYMKRARYLKALRGDPYSISWGIIETGPPPQGFVIIGNPPPGALDHFYQEELHGKPFRPINRVDTISQIYRPAPVDIPNTGQPASSKTPTRKKRGRPPISPQKLAAFQHMLLETTLNLYHGGTPWPERTEVFVCWPENLKYPKAKKLPCTENQFSYRVELAFKGWSYTDWDDFLHHILPPTT